MQTQLLVTAFEPFNGRPLNPSEVLVRSLHEKGLLPAGVKWLVLPVSYQRATELLRKAIEENPQAAVLMFGLAQSRKKISLERVALNWVEAGIADADGEKPPPGPLRVGKEVFLSELPLEAWVSELRANGVPAEVSLTAGGYVCNAVYFTAQEALFHRGGGAGLFVHLPPLPEDCESDETPMPLSEMEKAAQILMNKILQS